MSDEGENVKTRVTRADRGGTDTLRAPQRLPSGFLRIEGRISRTGIQEYPQADGSILRELRPPEEVFDPESLASFVMLPITNQHPPEGMLDANSAPRRAVGSVGESVRPDGQHVAASLILYDAKAIAEAEGGKRQLSCGYSCELDFTPGEWEGQKYDAIQRRIRGNHVALVDEARCGATCSARLDCACKRMAGSIVNEVSPKTEETMSKALKVDGLSIEVTDGTITAIQHAIDTAVAKEQARANQAEKALGEEKEKTAKETVRADEAVRKLQAEPERLRARFNLEAEAKKHLGQDAKVDGDDLSVKKAVIAKLRPKAKLDGQSDAYVAALFDVAIADVADAPTAVDLARTVATPTVDGKPVDLRSAREKMIERQKAAAQPEYLRQKGAQS